MTSKWLNSTLILILAFTFLKGQRCLCPSIAASWACRTHAPWFSALLPIQSLLLVPPCLPVGVTQGPRILCSLLSPLAPSVNSSSCMVLNTSSILMFQPMCPVQTFPSVSSHVCHCLSDISTWVSHWHLVPNRAPDLPP